MNRSGARTVTSAWAGLTTRAPRPLARGPRPLARGQVSTLNKELTGAAPGTRWGRMARPLRIDRAGAWYHITSRGIDRRRIYNNDRDRCRWLELLAEVAATYGWRVHGYVMMENHYHLILELAEPNLSRSMQWLQTSYSMGYNRRHGRVGPLFQGRFQAHVIDPIGWGLELSRYLHLNPVRTAKLGLDKRARQADRIGARGRPEAVVVRKRIEHLRNYRWSSYRAYVGREPAPDWLTCHRILELGGLGAEPKRREAYARYVEEAVREGLPATPWEQLRERLVLGSAAFLREVRQRVSGPHREQPQSRGWRSRPNWEETLRVVEEWRGEKWVSFRDRHGDWGRELAFCLGRRVSGLSLRQLGEAAGGVDYAAVSGAIQRFERRMADEPSIRKVFDKLKRTLLRIET